MRNELLERIKSVAPLQQPAFEQLRKRRDRKQRRGRIAAGAFAIAIAAASLYFVASAFRLIPAKNQPTQPGPTTAGSPNGLIAYSFANGPVQGVATVTPKGSPVGRVLFPQLSEAEDASWSADGSKLAFSADQGIFVMTAQLTDLTKITGDGWGPSWSPDAKQIAFYREGESTGGVYVMNADGSDVRRLTSNRDDWDVGWSPQGSQIVYRNQDGIWTVGVEGGEPKRLVANGFDPAWSPDGTKIAFVREHWDKTAGTVMEIWATDANGDNPAQLSSLSLESRYPAWSPDGTKIVFQVDPPEGDPTVDSQYGNAAIYVMGSDGSNPTKIVGGSYDKNGDGYQCCQMPTWQRAG